MPAHRTKKNAQGLTEIEARFVAQFQVDLSQWKAMMRADGSTDPKAKNWRQLGWAMMQRPHVKKAAETQMRRVFAKLDVSIEHLKAEMVRMALFDPAHLTAVTGPDDIAQLPENVRRAIVGWSWDRNGNFTVKTAKESALEMLGRHFGMFKDRVELSGKVTQTHELSDEQLAAIAAGGSR